MRKRYLALGAMTVATIMVATAAWAPVSAAKSVQPTEKDWQNQLVQVPHPAKGCFTGGYPSLTWRGTGCGTAPNIPLTPPNGPRPALIIGNTDDISAQVPPGFFVSNAIGSFENVSVASESGPIANSGPSYADTYTLQVNTNPFASTACAGSPNPGCLGWEQFVYFNNGHTGFAAVAIQYWLLYYNAPCPAGGWTFFSFGGSVSYCYRNSTAATLVPVQPITNLPNISLAGRATASGDGATLFVSGVPYSVTGDNSVNAAAGWTTTEFNVFGYGGNSSGGGMASFNAGASLTVRTRVIYGGTAAPTCVAHGFTGEYNNLSFGTPPPGSTPPGPAVIFIQDTVGGMSANCAYASTIGDVHAHTVAGLAYDFQGVGDYELAQVGPDFEVQARHVSGAPTWPDASVNQAIGTRMGKTKVAVCGPGRVVADGRGVQLTEGRPLALPEGVVITLIGGVYIVTDASGNSVRVTPHPGYLDVSVGVGTWPTKVRGLLGNPENNVKLLEASDGTIFTVPLSFNDLYHKFGDSWRVKPATSLLSPCGTSVQESNPSRPFFADNLDPSLRERSRSICLQAGVRQAWLDACTLDVAVLGAKATEAYLSERLPVADGNR